MSISTSLGIKCDREPRKTRMLFSSQPLLKECALRVAGCWWGASPPHAACDVTCAVWSPWERTLMHTGNNQGNTGRAQKNANIFIVLKRKIHTRTHTRTYEPNATPPPSKPLTHPNLTRLYTHTYITQEKSNKKKKKKNNQPPWQNSPQVHLHKTLSLTKWLHLTSWVGGRTLPVAASYLRIPQSFSRQATVSWPPL